MGSSPGNHDLMITLLFLSIKWLSVQWLWQIGYKMSNLWIAVHRRLACFWLYMCGACAQVSESKLLHKCKESVCMCEPTCVKTVWEWSTPDTVNLWYPSPPVTYHSTLTEETLINDPKFRVKVAALPEKCQYSCQYQQFIWHADRTTLAVILLACPSYSLAVWLSYLHQSSQVKSILFI